jgi:hypothetical protein
MADSRVEALAAELTALPLAELSPAEVDMAIAGVICDATPDDGRAALDRAAEIMQQRTAATARHAEMWQMIEQLSHATLCPDGTSAVTWLEGLDLIEPDGAGGWLVTPKASTRLV